VPDSPDIVPTPTPPGRRWSRRKFLRRALGGGAVAATLGYAWGIEPHWVEVVRRPLAIDGLPEALVGKRLVQLSDLHIGPIVDPQFMRRSLESVGELAPDLIVVTGDLMTCNRDEQVDSTLEALRALPAAPLGRIVALGNHDYGGVWQCDQAADRLSFGLERRDFQVLRNEIADVEGLQVVGIDDFYSKHYHPSRAFDLIDDSRPVLTLCHNPDAVDHPAWSELRGWVLAGHTHGGQCKAPFLRPPILPVRNRRYVAGEYELAPGRRMYVNRGLGYLHRVRFNCRPEITVFTLQRSAGQTALGKSLGDV